MRGKRINFKIAVVLIVALLLSVNAKAQEVKYGIMAGMNLVSLSISNASGLGFHYDNYSGITFGVNGVVEFRSDSWWGISLEPGYIKKGGGLDLTYSKPGYRFFSDNSRLYSNIELPVLLNMDLNSKFYLSAGFGLDYTLSSSINNQFRAIAVMTPGPPNYELLTNLDHKLSCSTILGISYKFNDTYNICLRYSFGLTRLAAVSLIDNVRNSVYANYLQLSLKYNIN
ncbi:MAG: outer membrane beta-barrel protein [Paludibacter sp.]|nr:outer membrane beta-barrel protein [Paludibacter sp.]